MAGGPGDAAGPKVSVLVAGMVAGADSIADMGLLRHGAMARLFDGVRAPSTLGTFLRAFTFGHVRQLDGVAARFTAGLARHAPLIARRPEVTYLDGDDTARATYGYAKQGATVAVIDVNGYTLSTYNVVTMTRTARISAGSGPTHGVLLTVTG